MLAITKSKETVNNLNINILIFSTKVFKLKLFHNYFHLLKIKFHHYLWILTKSRYHDYVHAKFW